MTRVRSRVQIAPPPRGSAGRRRRFVHRVRCCEGRLHNLRREACVEEGVIRQQQPCAHGLRTRHELELPSAELKTARFGLDAHGRQVISRQVVGRGAHIERARRDRNLEAISDQLRRQPRVELQRHLEQIHRRVHARGLLE